MQKRYSTEYSLVYKGFANFGMTVKNSALVPVHFFSSVGLGSVFSIHFFPHRVLKKGFVKALQAMSAARRNYNITNF